MRPHRGTTILVLGILSIICCGPLGIFSWVMGKSDLAAIDSGAMDPSGRQLTNIGMILGIIGLVIFVIAIVVQIFFGGIAAIIAGSQAGATG